MKNDKSESIQADTGKILSKLLALEIENQAMLKVILSNQARLSTLLNDQYTTAETENMYYDMAEKIKAVLLEDILKELKK